MSDYQGQQYPGQAPQQYPGGAPQQYPPAAPQPQPAPPPHAAPPPPAAAPSEPSGMSGMFQDASTLAATGILAAVALAIAAGVFAFLADPVLNDDELRQRLLSLTSAAGIADVALLAVGVMLLLLTPDPPGGIARSLLLRVNAGLAGIITLYAVIRALVLVSLGDTAFFFKISDLTSNVGVALAAATVTYYAAKESFLKERGQI